MPADLNAMSFTLLAAGFLAVGALLGMAIGSCIWKQPPGSVQRGRWGWNWQEESTKRGVAHILGALAALLATRQSPEAGAVTLAVSEFLVGILGAARTDTSEGRDGR